MAVRTRIEAQNLNFEAALKDTLSPEEQRKAFAGYAQDIIEQVKAQNARVLGRVPPHSISVDGREGAPLASVKLGGTVFVEFELALEALDWIGQMLRQHSPVKSGLYRDSHVLIADGVAVDPGAVPPIADRYTFVNVQPYARKIERGHSPRRPEGVYQAVAQMAASTKKFGNVARIRFGYETPLFGAINTWAGSASGIAMAQQKSGRRKELQGEWLRRQPAIIITLTG